MKKERKYSLTIDDIVIERDIEKKENSITVTNPGNDKQKILGQDYTVDGPKPNCDGWD